MKRSAKPSGKTKPSVKIGQRVAWKTSQGETRGRVEAKTPADVGLDLWRKMRKRSDGP